MSRVSATLTRLARQRRWPIYVAIELTLRCNLKCLHCYNFNRQTTKSPSAKRDLSADLVRAAIDDIARLGGYTIAFTGGEAALHPDLPQLIAHARSHHLAVALKSNGTLLQQGRLQRLLDAGVGAIDLSLYGTTAAVHDAFTEVGGSFDETMAAARAVREVGLELTINYSLTQANAHQVGEFLALGEALGCSINVDPVITARNDGDEGPMKMRVDRDTLLALYRGPLANMVSQPDHNPERSVQCSCALSGCAIGADGEVYPCIAARVPSGNLHQNSFAEIWADSPEFKRIRALELNDFAACKGCPERAYCQRSSGAVYQNTGNYTGSEAWTCMQAEALRVVQS